MTAHNSRNASNSKNESNNRTASTIGTPARARMLTKVVKQQHAGRPTTSGTLLKPETTAAAATNGNIIDVNSRRTARIRQ
jgi:hypothetical protein